MWRLFTGLRRMPRCKNECLFSLIYGELPEQQARVAQFVEKPSFDRGAVILNNPFDVPLPHQKYFTELFRRCGSADFRSEDPALLHHSALCNGEFQMINIKLCHCAVGQHADGRSVTKINAVHDRQFGARIFFGNNSAYDLGKRFKAF